MLIWFALVTVIIGALILITAHKLPKSRARLDSNAIRALYTLGNQVAVFEQLDSANNWEGTIVGTDGDLLTVRDNHYPFGVAQVTRADIFPIGTTFDGPNPFEFGG